MRKGVSVQEPKTSVKAFRDSARADRADCAGTERWGLWTVGAGIIAPWQRTTSKPALTESSVANPQPDGWF
jgi:hypothetical protein